ncbi:30S ribosomal protein S9 [Candidatus Curtissbacteria bacterium RIFCSPLOWO2_01_FULL_42_26]|uniref:Small ribosomal subunit protein uS9 n=1 Tax=Candidatus Curtissbacteria bacterium RIFCSPLOWO2_01_FULL_42_26 TaxID=1797729 RepID=A0A1F5I2T2_9BACT|nr:MAG: 30S ribosomal protein S9 [Candidatus Curtissbacteria bacterium RIFCSPLOWO2_01_FULL_42_26]
MDPQDSVKQEKPKSSAGFTYTVGRRKEAAARVRLYKGKGQTMINGAPIEQYFPTAVEKSQYLKPFNITSSEGAYYATIKVKGSGKNGQLKAVIHGISRALDKANPDFHTLLKKAGLLTRDPRVKERRKYGLAQKARKGKQSPKR